MDDLEIDEQLRLRRIDEGCEARHVVTQPVASVGKLDDRVNGPRDSPESRAIAFVELEEAEAQQPATRPELLDETISQPGRCVDGAIVILERQATGTSTAGPDIGSCGVRDRQPQTA